MNKKELAEQIAEAEKLLSKHRDLNAPVYSWHTATAAIIEAMGVQPESIGINPKYRKLASKLLEMAAIEYGTHGCNDLDERFFDDWTNEERVQLAKDYEQWNSEGEYYNPKFLTIPDYALMDFFAHLLNNEQGVQVSDTRNDDSSNTAD